MVMRWVIGSEPTMIPIEDAVHELIERGVGNLQWPSATKFNANANYPIYIDEPLIILCLSSILQEHSWSQRNTWIANSFSAAPNQSATGSAFEMLALVLMEKFGGRITALGDVFYGTESSLLSRKVTLVALRRGSSDIMECCQVSGNSGSSDRLSFKANSPNDVLSFLQNPLGKPFLFPDIHMGPDLACFLLDEETKELILLLVQLGLGKDLTAATSIQAVDSVTPELFYTIKVGLKLLKSLTSKLFFGGCRRKMGRENNMHL